MAKTVFFKVNSENLLPSRFSNTGWYDEMYVGTQYPDSPAKEWPLDKVTLVVKIGKKRKLLKGTMRANPHSSPSMGLRWEYMFKPKNMDRAKTLLPYAFD